MARLKRRDFAVMSLSFLDVVCCGFGAMILLLTLTKLGQRRGLEAIEVDLTGLVAKLEEELHRIKGETDVLEREMKGKVEQLSDERRVELGVGAPPKPKPKPKKDEKPEDKPGDGGKPAAQQ